MEKDASRERSAAEEATELGGRVRATVGLLYRRFRSERPEGALGDAALEVLTFLQKHGPHSLTELSERGHVAPATMSQSVNRLTSAGYAVRVSDPHDRRKVLFRTTPEGDELALATRSRRNAWLNARLHELGPEDQNAIIRACQLLSDIAGS